MADVQKKADSMRRKTQDFHRLFTAGDSETVIQDYSCMMNGVLGRMYISQNLLCFYSGFPERIEKIQFSKVTDVQKDKGLLFQGISIMHDRNGQTQKTLFTNFSHRDETFELVAYIWQNPPSYVTADKVEEDNVGQVVVGRTVGGNSRSSAPGGLTLGGSGSWGDIGTTSGSFERHSAYGMAPLGGGSGSSSATSSQYGSLGQTQAQATQVRVDVEKAREALRLAYSTREVTGDTINKIEQQGQQLLRMEAHLDNMSANLDKSESLIKGMESVFSYIGNKWRKGGKNPPPIVDYGNRAIKIEKMEPPLDIEILCKNPDDSFTPALLRLHTMGFACVDATTGKPLNPAYTWPYSDVAQLLMRARHEHLDIKFTLSSNKERFRLMSSYIQLIVNELILRCPKGSVQVIFEPGVRQFEYDNPALSKIPPTSRTAQSSGFSRPEATSRPSALLLSATADQQTRDDLDEVDRHMDEVSRVVGDIGDMAVAMGQELSSQIEHIGRIDAKVTENNDRITSHTSRMNKLMS